MAAEEEVESRGLFGWLLQPWLVPVAAAAVLAVVMVGALRFSPWSSDVAIPSLPKLTGALAKKPVPEAPKVATNPSEKSDKNRVAVASSPPPSDVLQRPELFVDYSVIRDLDILESGKGDTESHAG